MIVPEARISRIEKYFDKDIPKELKLNEYAYIHVTSKPKKKDNDRMKKNFCCIKTKK